MARFHRNESNLDENVVVTRRCSYSVLVCLFCCTSIVCSVISPVNAEKNHLHYNNNNNNNNNYNIPIPKTRNSPAESKTYFDFLQDVGNDIQIAKQLKVNKDFFEDLSDKIMRLYRPLGKYDVAPGGRYYYNYNSDGKSDHFDAAFDNLNVLHRLRSLLHDIAAETKTSKSAIKSRCVNDTGRLITGIFSFQNWTGQFFDATGKPGPSLVQGRYNFVGNFDQCRAAEAPPDNEGYPGFKGNYCVVDFITYYPGLKLTLGACLPRTCSSKEISTLMRELVKNVKELETYTIKNVVTECRPAERKFTTATILAIALVTLIVFMIILGTIYDIVFVQRMEKQQENLPETLSCSREYESIGSNIDSNGRANCGESSPLINSVTYINNKTVILPNLSSTSGKVLIAFSIYTNGKKILNTSRAPGSIGVIHGIRFLSMSWVILCHIFAFIPPFSLNAFTELPNVLQRWTFTAIANGFVSVDTFFTLSGLLTSYLTIKEMERRKTWKINWLLFYFHRFWRLTPPYMLTLLIYLGLQRFMGKGPLWANEQPLDRTHCEKNWWKNLLYINNIVDSSTMCFGISWYLASDVQFFILSPLLLVPFYFNKILGFLACTAGLFITWTTTGVLSTVDNWPTSTESLKPVKGRVNEAWRKDYYIVPWCRVGPFIVGIAAGYILARTKANPFRIRRLVVFTGWVVAIATGLAVVYGIYGDITGDHPSTVGTAALYNAVSRSAWAACVSWVIIACSAGYGGPVNSLLSWSPFVVLGRLTYMSYLVHFNLLFMLYNSLGALLYVDEKIIVIIYLGMLVFVNMVAFVASLALESPMIGLEKALLRNERRE